MRVQMLTLHYQQAAIGGASGVAMLVAVQMLGTLAILGSWQGARLLLHLQLVPDDCCTMPKCCPSNESHALFLP